MTINYVIGTIHGDDLGRTLMIPTYHNVAINAMLMLMSENEESEQDMVEAEISMDRGGTTYEADSGITYFIGSLELL